MGARLYRASKSSVRVSAEPGAFQSTAICPTEYQEGHAAVVSPASPESQEIEAAFGSGGDTGDLPTVAQCAENHSAGRDRIPTMNSVDSGRSDTSSGSPLSRHAAYMERKKSRQARGANTPKDATAFLSKVPEISADIAYKFYITVVGVSARDITKKASKSRILEQRMKFSSSLGQEAHRCMCPVPYISDCARKTDDDEDGDSGMPKLAKIYFKSADRLPKLPLCRTRFEALCSALVFVLLVDPKDGELDCQEQLIAYEHAVDALRFEKKQLRPVRTLLICSHGDSNGSMPWLDSALADIELSQANLWKFGPVRLDDCDSLYEVFATIASQRIIRSQLSAGHESDGSQQSEMAEAYEAEREEVDIYPMLQPTQPTQDISGTSAHAEFRHQWLSPMERGAA